MASNAHSDSGQFDSNVWEDDRASTIRQPSIQVTHEDDDQEGSSGEDSEEDEGNSDSEQHPGDYSTQIEEFMEDGESNGADEDEDEDEEGFVYDGVDADESPGNYRDRMRDVLEAEEEEEQDSEEEHQQKGTSEYEVEKSLLHETTSEQGEFDDEPLVSYFCAAWAYTQD